MPTQEILTNPAALRRVTRGVVLSMLGIGVRQFHNLVERGILPQPVAHGQYDLLDVIDCYALRKAGVPIPTTFREAAQREAIGTTAMRVYLRRAGEDV